MIGLGGKFVCCLMQGVRLGTERTIQWICLGQLEPMRVGRWCIRMTSVITHELTSFKSLKKKTNFVHLPVSERGKTKLHKSRSEDLRMQSVRQKCLPPRRGTHFDPTHQRGLGCRMFFRLQGIEGIGFFYSANQCLKILESPQNGAAIFDKLMELLNQAAGATGSPRFTAKAIRAKNPGPINIPPFRAPKMSTLSKCVSMMKSCVFWKKGTWHNISQKGTFNL